MLVENRLFFNHNIPYLPNIEGLSVNSKIGLNLVAGSKDNLCIRAKLYAIFESKVDYLDAFEVKG